MTQPDFPLSDGQIQQLGQFLQTHGYPAALKKWADHPAFFLNGYMFCGVYQDRIFLHLQEDAVEEAIKTEPGVSTFNELENPGLEHYILLPMTILTEPTRLKSWLDLSSQYLLSLPRIIYRYFSPTLNQVTRDKLSQFTRVTLWKLLIMAIIISSGFHLIGNRALLASGFFLMLSSIFILLALSAFAVLRFNAHLQVKFLKFHDIAVIFKENQLIVHFIRNHQTEIKTWDWINYARQSDRQFELFPSMQLLDRLIIPKDELDEQEIKLLLQWLTQHQKI